ncbi:mannose-1-phosphate guanylyltransferase [Primorskyibacter sp. 2E107]|uniref:mannose-1-phosphate guanylyltransferase n=1 Tax=Primorskyibacter sp. 2E107 TaxID=3403458 RepID=UPI003AF4A8F8
MTTIYPLIICGGKGTRLWPLSRTQSPKQFQKISGPESSTFFQVAVQRHSGPVYNDPVIVTGVTHRGTVVKQLREIQSNAQIICEPMGRNTGPAVLAAAHAISRKDPNALFVVVPADHIISGPLTETIEACIPAAQAGHIITFGIPPRYAETGFGYITDAGPMEGYEAIRQVGGFVEKPPAEEAQALIDSKAAYWASGLSMFSARTIIDEYARFDPRTAAYVADSVEFGSDTPDALYLNEADFAEAASEPTEGVVFEKTDRIALAPLDVSWDDVGSWLAMYNISPQDQNGNVLQGDVIALDAVNTMVRADSRLVSVVGLTDVIVIDTPDALLVARMDETQSVKKVVEQLKASHRTETEVHAEAKPAMVPFEKQKEVARLVESDKFHLGTAEIDVGRTVILDKGPRNRQVIVVQGTVHASGPGWSKTATEGGRIYADENGEVRIVNSGDDKAELLFVTLEKLDVGAVSLPMASNA